ncbi:MAG: hypothetical protein AB7G11_14205 [Phycisphaerales bacterium]
MSPAPFNMKRQYQRLGELLRPIDIESSLLFCNHVLAAWRGEESDPVIRNLVGQFRLPPAPFLVHLAARQCLLQSLGPSNRKMGTEDFKRLFGLLWEILDHDPAMEDPGWAQSDPTGWAIRYLGLQQRVIDILLQTYGLAVALFTDDMPRGADEAVDIPARVQDLLRMCPAVFMRAGFVAGALRMANSGRVKLAGTITTDLVANRSSEVGAGVADNWSRFIELASCTPSDFKRRSRESTMPTADSRYDLYRFNLLRRFPMIDIGGARFVTADPQLVIARTTLGMYYDALEADGENFTRPFGYRFADLVGDIARSACGKERVWSEPSVSQQGRELRESKKADHAILGDVATVLIECKALRPSMKLLMMGDPADTDTLVARVAAAVRQLTDHAEAIRAGKWAGLGLSARDCYGIVVTYGCIPTGNGLLFRGKVRDLLAKDGCAHLPYLILSISEFDSFLRLAELGNGPDAVMAALTANDNGGFPGSFQSALSTDAISSATRRRGEAFLATLPDRPDAA